MDQLKVLTAASRTGSGEKREAVSPVKAERTDYEKITMEAAALSREKWRQTEGEAFIMESVLFIIVLFFFFFF